MFYDRWGKENWIVCGRAQRAQYPEYRQTCSIKAVFQGSAVDEIALIRKDKQARDARLYRMESMELPEIH
jgi:hypothetical protein